MAPSSRCCESRNALAPSRRAQLATPSEASPDQRMQGSSGRWPRRRLNRRIPPSSSQILYAWVAQQSVLRCFLSTVVPGLILIFLLCVVNRFLMKDADLKIPERIDNFPRELMHRGGRAFPALLMPVIILGGIYGGIMTPTEAAGVAVVYAIPVGWFIYRGLNRENIWPTLRYAGTTIGVVMLMVFMVGLVVPSG